VLVSGPAHAASFALNSDGTFAYTPATGYTGTDTFQYYVSDGTLNSSPVSVTRNVTGQPVGHNDIYYLSAAGTITVSADAGVLGNDFSPTGATLTAQLVGSLSGPAFDSDGSFTYSPSQQPQTVVTFSYQAVANGVVGTVPGVVTLVPLPLLPAVTLTSVQFQNAYQVIHDDGRNPSFDRPSPAWWQSAAPGQRNPLAYVAGSKVAVQATFTVSNPALLDLAHLSLPWDSTGDSTLTFGAGANTPTGLPRVGPPWRYTWVVQGVQKQAGVSGQGPNPNPLADFKRHVVAQIKLNNSIVLFDPSYGEWHQDTA
jgi:hypothetical protein